VLERWQNRAIVPLSLTPRLMQEQKIRFVATVAALVSPYSELPYLQRTLMPTK